MTRVAADARRQTYRSPLLGVHQWHGTAVRVIVAHEIRLLGAALGLEFGGAGQVLSQTSSGAAAVALSELLAPQVVLMGDLLEDGAAEHFLPRLLQSGARVLIIGEELDGAHGIRFLRLGASGVVPLASSLAQLSDALFRVAGGEVVVPPLVMASILIEWRERPPSQMRTSLTQRELDVLAAMAEGLGTKAIARRLGIAYKTTENHKTRIFQKLGISNQAEALTLVHSGDWSGQTRLSVREPSGDGADSSERERPLNSLMNGLSLAEEQSEPPTYIPGVGLRRERANHDSYD